MSEPVNVLARIGACLLVLVSAPGWNGRAPSLGAADPTHLGARQPPSASQLTAHWRQGELLHSGGSLAGTEVHYQLAILLAEYEISFQDATYRPQLGQVFQAPNRAHNMRVYFAPEGPVLLPRTGFDPGAEPPWVLRIRLAEIGRGGALLQPGPAALQAEGSRVEYRRGTVTEWYRNDTRGLEQGFTLERRPNGEGELTLVIVTEGGLHPVQDGGASVVHFRSESGAVVLDYKQLTAFDAAGRALPARIEVNAARNLIRLLVNDDDALYPVTVDPLATSPSWDVEGEQDYAYFGASVATAGDVNGDGFSDVLVGAPGFDGGQEDEGRVFLFEGSASGLSTSPAWSAESDQMGAQMGLSVATAGDVNKDGYSDIIVGAPMYSSGQSEEGAVFVWTGSASGMGAKGTPVNADWSAESNQADAAFGISVATATDVNGDGASDVIVGGPEYDGMSMNGGMAFVWLGSGSGLGLSGNPGNADWYAEGDGVSMNFGVAVAPGGDINGDGYGDIVVAANRFSSLVTPNEGAAFVWYGGAGGLGPSGNHNTSDWRCRGDQTGLMLGDSVGPAGDVNGDGYADLLVSAIYYTNPQEEEGLVMLWLGSASGLGEEGTPANADWTAESNSDNARLGTEVFTAGDVNGDGYADIVAGAAEYSHGHIGEGAAFVWFGGAEGLGSDGSPANADWSHECDQAECRMGLAAATAGDVDGDGYADVIIGAYSYTSGNFDEGRALVFQGSPQGPAAEAQVDLRQGDSQANTWFGWAVAGAGDVNGDGVADVLVGAPFYDEGQADEGKVFLFLGGLGGLTSSAAWTATGDQVSAGLGYALAGGGDFNSDDYTDVLVGAPYYDDVATDEGAVFCWLGAHTGMGPAGTPANADWSYASGQAGASLGWAVAWGGDVNGDGLGDALVGAPGYDAASDNEGRVLLFAGTPTGLAGTSLWSAESLQEGGQMGFAVASAGDVNRDGFSDVLIGANKYDNGEVDEGAVFAWYGARTGPGASGTPLNADWMVEGDEANARMGFAVAWAGDENGDGYSDVIVGAPLFDGGVTDQGKALIFRGGTGGLAASPAATAWSGQANAQMGWALTGGGDLNGDGYSDQVMGMPYFDTGLEDAGHVKIRYGLSGNYAVSLLGAQSLEGFGNAVASVGDVNGDGYGDLLVGAPLFDTPTANQGRAVLFYGNGSRGTAVRPVQGHMVSALFGYIARLGSSAWMDSFTTTVSLVTPFGRGKVKPEIETKPLGTLFTGSGTYRWVTYLDSGSVGTAYAPIEDLERCTQYHWRVRLLYDPVTLPFQPSSRWISVPWNGWNEADLRTACGDVWLPIVLRNFP